MRIKLIIILSLLSIQFVLAQNGLAVPIKKTVTIAEYFHFIDSLIVQYDSLYTSQISEHHIVRNNPWIIDSLANTDYYRMTERDSFVYDQKKLIILRVNDTIIIPDHDRVVELDSTFKRTYIDVNIPEFKLRIFQD
ncbi:MAG: hypothetical protein KJN68_00470, partial [Bacteroidia bacterium]|nr:hypothetical protein [Bacteroidia bacterium]